jgi:hypothetical protein
MKQRHDVICCLTRSKPPTVETPASLPDPPPLNRNVSGISTRKTNSDRRSLSSTINAVLRPSSEAAWDDRDGFSKRCCSILYMPGLMSIGGRTSAVAAFFVITVVLGYGAARVDSGYTGEESIPYSSYLKHFIDVSTELSLYAPDVFSPVGVYFDGVNMSSSSVQSRVLAAEVSFVNNHTYNTAPYTSWLDSFLSWSNASTSYSGYTTQDGVFGEPALFPAALGQFLCIASHLRFQRDVVCAPILNCTSEVPLCDVQTSRSVCCPRSIACDSLWRSLSQSTLLPYEYLRLQ